jgi:hypothetical protein
MIRLNAPPRGADMTTLTCPKCRRGLSDDALDAGQCPLCGFVFDGPVVLAAGTQIGSPRFLFATAVLFILASVSAVAAVVAMSTWPVPQQRQIEFVAPPPPPPPPLPIPVPPLAPPPHEPQRPDANPPMPPVDPPEPVAVEPPKKKDGPRPIGVVMKVDPKIEPKRHFDHPDDTARLPDLNSGDRVILTGKVRVLKLGSVNGKGVLDASGLVAEEVIITGDLNNEAQVLVHAPNGVVTVGGYVTGASKLTIAAPGGEVIVTGSGRLSGGPLVTVTAKRLEVKCPMSGNARVNVTLTAPGTLKLGLMEESATVTYKKAGANDPAPTIEKGILRGGAKVIPAS